MFNQIEPNQITQVIPKGEEEEVVSVPFLQNKKVWIIAGSFLLLLIIVLFTWLFLSAKNSKKVVTPITNENEITTTTVGVLPVETSTSTDAMATTTTTEELEKYSFSNFYQDPAPTPDFTFKDYVLPLNVKIDALNYYDISRKINLDDGVSGLNTNGFSILTKPLDKDFTNFYEAYSWLSSKEVPLLITSDFLLHYHQNTIKQVSKDLEENIFYDNLWRISKILYDVSKDRYEARLAKIGNVNDQTLEGERLAMAYFAVSLKLLEPSVSQIDTTGKDATKFTSNEASGLYFTVLPYLQSDAGEEIRLIKSATGAKKSPVLLYTRNYTDFVVPMEYKRTEKLYNFYLASTWLNSVFPLVVKDKNCPNCLLDKEDARLSLIASSFITKDFSANSELKNRWALVYKLISYSKGLRDDLNYRNYDDVMKELFGEAYDPESLFAESNPDATKNMDKMRAKLLALQFNDFQGALNKTKDKPRLGFKLLSDYYFPNSYVLDNLSGPTIGAYNKPVATSTVLTVCQNTMNRCNGFGLDVIGLVTDKLESYKYWMENTDFASYNEKLLSLKNELKIAPIWHGNNFWSTLGAIKMVFETNNGQMQIYSHTDSWHKRLVDTAAAAWVDLQLPLEPLTIASTPTNTGLSTDVSFNDNFYIEPNYALVQKLIADNEMIYGMFEVMGVNKQVSSVAISLKEENTKLRQFSELIKKELNGEAFSSDNQSFISSVAKQYQLTQAPTSRLYLKTGDKNLYEDISIKLMALVYELNEGKFIAVGPVFSYQESR